MAQPDRLRRYLLFADILGTSSLYTSRPPDFARLEHRRTTLEHCARISTFPHLPSDQGNHLSVFSDTVLFACTAIDRVLAAATQMFTIFAERSLHADSEQDIHLLRGGIAFGEALSSNALTPSNHVSIAKIFDTSLALAYELDGVRRGARIFVCKDTFDAILVSSRPWCHTWSAVAGIGRPVSPAYEYIWPAEIINHDVGTYERILNGLFETWYRLFVRRPGWTVKQYDNSLYQLDETIKLWIRAAAFAPRAVARRVWQILAARLPTAWTEVGELDVRFTWGTWLQIFWMLLVLHEKYGIRISKRTLTALLRENYQIVVELGYASTFRAELYQVDYKYLLTALTRLEVLQST